VGDIVELQVSFIMVPLRDNKFKATMVLRSILVLDRTYTQVKIMNTHILIISHHLLTDIRLRSPNVLHSGKTIISASNKWKA